MRWYVSMLYISVLCPVIFQTDVKLNVTDSWYQTFCFAFAHIFNVVSLHHDLHTWAVKEICVHAYVKLKRTVKIVIQWWLIIVTMSTSRVTHFFEKLFFWTRKKNPGKKQILNSFCVSRFLSCLCNARWRWGWFWFFFSSVEQERIEIQKLRQGDNLILGFSIGGGIDQDPAQNPFSQDKSDKVSVCVSINSLCTVIVYSKYHITISLFIKTLAISDNFEPKYSKSNVKEFNFVPLSQIYFKYFTWTKILKFHIIHSWGVEIQCTEVQKIRKVDSGM